MAVPKTFLPAGDSSFIWGVMIAREGSSPEQMHALQDRADEVIRQNPAVEATFTMTGNGQFLASNQGLLLDVPQAARRACADSGRSRAS